MLLSGVRGPAGGRKKIGAALSGKKNSCGPPARVPARAVQIATRVYAKHRNPLFITNGE